MSLHQCEVSCSHNVWPLASTILFSLHQYDVSLHQYQVSFQQCCSIFVNIRLSLHQYVDFSTHNLWFRCINMCLFFQQTTWLLVQQTTRLLFRSRNSVLQCVAVCCSVLQCVAVCCSVTKLRDSCFGHVIESCTAWMFLNAKCVKNTCVTWLMCQQYATLVSVT